MKTLSLSLFLIGGLFFASEIFSQTYIAVPDSICINEGDIVDLNVFTNDFIENPDLGVFLEQSTADECFFNDEEGNVRNNLSAPVSCCGTHTLSYFACSNDGGGCGEATVTIVVKCGKPDCSLFNLLDLTGDPVGQEGPGCVSICEFSNTTFYVPYNINNTYNWNVNSNGGSDAPGANPAEINVTWGPTGSGNIQLVVSNAAGNTIQTFTICVDIMLGPTAAFSSNGSVCLDSPITFTNLSTNADEYDWDFGDGTFLANVAGNPSHIYDAPGTYSVTLYATNFNYDDQGNQLCCCTDSVSMDVIVDPLPGPNIYWISTLCEGDSSKYWTDASNCTTYNWAVGNTNGDVIPWSGQGNDTICVLWNAGFDGIISLNVAGCDSSYCTDPTTVSVPIIPSVSQITGLDEVCINSTHLYSLPKWNSVEYIWTVLDVNGDPVSFDGQGGHQISINWTVAGIGSIHVDYSSEFLNGTSDHSGTECNGVADLNVNVKPFFDIFPTPTVVCVGATSFISATSSPSSDYNWTVTPSVPMSAVGANLTVTWNTPGTYVVTAEPNDLSVYCNEIETVIIEVIEIPLPLTIEGPDSICAGDAVLYTVTSSETGVGFIWNVIGGTPTFSNANSVLVTWTGPGSVSVYQYMLSSPFCQSDTIGINVVEKSVAGPLDVTGSAACTNSISTYTLSPSQIDDADITWSIDALTDGSIISGQGTEVIQVQWNNDPGPISVDVDVDVCGNISSFSLLDTIYSPIEPVITQVGNLCPGVPAYLQTGNSFVSYLWSTGSVSDTANITMGGNYSVTTIDNNGCSATAYFNVNELLGPVANISSGDYPILCVDAGGSVNIVALSNPGYTFEWFCNNVSQGPPSPTSSFLHTNTDVVDEFDYYFEVTDGATGCIATSDIFEVSQISCPGGPGGCTPEPHTIIPSASFTSNPPNCDELLFSPGLTNGSVASWSFGDGNTSNATMPTYTYGEAGCYNVWLTARVPEEGGTGDSCLVSRDFEVCVPVIADFSFQYLGCGDVQFTDLSTFIDPVDPIIGWSWTVSPNPPFSSSQNPLENFGSGTHSVTLTVSLGSGCQAVVTKDIEIGSVNIDSITATSIPDPPCVGDAVTFSTVAPNAVDWFWNFGDGATFSGAGPIHSYNVAGTYIVTLTVTDADGCTDTDNISVLVNPGIPDGLSISPGDQAICEGETVTLTAPPGYSYLWSTNETSQTIDVNDEGTYSVVITDANGCFKELDGITISVFPAPVAVISGNPIICDAGCTNLFAQQPAGTTYSWTNGSGVVGTFSSLTVCSGSINNPYTLTVTDANGCSDTSDPINVQVAISPSFTVDISPDACEGKPITLSINPVEPDVNYNWSNGGTGTSIVIYQAGIYTAVGTNVDTGCSFSASAVVNPLPDLCLVPVGCYEVCEPDTICGPIGLDTYVWLLDGLPTPGIPGMEHCVEASVSGIYNLVGTNEFGCVDTSGALILEVINCDEDPCENLTVTSDFINNTGELSDSCCVSLSYTGNTFDLLGMKIHSSDAEMLFDIGSINAQLDETGYNTSFIDLASDINGNPIPSAIPNFIEFCFGEVFNSPQTIIIDWYDLDAEVVCSDTLIFNCPVEPDCAYLQTDSIYCDDNQQVVYDITICNPNNAEFSVGYIEFEVFNPIGITMTPSPIDITGTPILPGTCQSFSIALSGADIAGDILCYNILSHESDPDLDPTTLCCSLDTIYCVDIPICDPCEFVGVESVNEIQGEDCCYSVVIYNDYEDDFFDEISICVLSPVTTLNVENPFGSGWFTQDLTSTSVSFIPTDGSLDLGSIEIPKLCISSEFGPNHLVEIKWLNNDDIYCRDTISLFCEPDCGYLFDDSVSCLQNNAWEFTSSIKNMTDHSINGVDITFDDPLLSAYNQSFATGVIPSLGTFTPINFIIGAPAMPGDSICFTVTLHDESEQGNHLTCCNFRYCIVLPECPPDPECICVISELQDHVSNGINCTIDASNPNMYTFQLTDFYYLQDCDNVFWDFGDGNFGSSVGGEAITYTYGATDPKVVCVRVQRIDDNGMKCDAKTCKSLVTKDSSNFLIYPNPTSGMFNVISKVEIAVDMMIDIRDVNNRPVFSKEVLYENSDAKIEMDIDRLSPGMYYIHFITKENHWVEKISKQ